MLRFRAIPPRTSNGASESEKIDQKRSANPKFAIGTIHAPRTIRPTSQFSSQATAIEVRAWAKSALMHDPLNARALRILGQLEAAEKNEATASKLMNAAAQLSLHESVAVYWSMLAAAEAKNYKTTIYYADVLLRTIPELSQVCRADSGKGRRRRRIRPDHSSGPRQQSTVARTVFCGAPG